MYKAKKQTRELRNALSQLLSSDFHQDFQDYSIGKWSLQQILWRKLDIHMQKNEVTLIHSNTYTYTKLKIDQRFKCKSIKHLQVNIRGKLHDNGFGKDFLNRISKTQATIITQQIKCAS